MESEQLFNEEYLTLTELPMFEEYTFWKNLKKRKIIINNNITDSVVERVIMQIIDFNEEDEGKEISKRKPIQLYINTAGGNVDIGLALCNVIEQSKTPVHGIVLGDACSMGALILMPCHKRIAYLFSNILIHGGSMFIGGTSNQVKDFMKFQEEKELQIENFILSKTKITKETYDKIQRQEWWLTAKQAKEYGIIDEIIGE